jgi:hypothetical protein
MSKKFLVFFLTCLVVVHFCDIIITWKYFPPPEYWSASVEFNPFMRFMSQYGIISVFVAKSVLVFGIGIPGFYIGGCRCINNNDIPCKRIFSLMKIVLTLHVLVFMWFLVFSFIAGGFYV